MDGLFTRQPEGFDALQLQHRVVNRLCRSLHGASGALHCLPAKPLRSPPLAAETPYAFGFEGVLICFSSFALSPGQASTLALPRANTAAIIAVSKRFIHILLRLNISV